MQDGNKASGAAVSWYMRTGVARCLIVILVSSTAAAQERTELVAGSEWRFPRLAGPIAALDAPLGTPNSLAVASNGDLLIADLANNLVLRLTSDGTLRVIAGNGVQASSGDGGPATAASVTPVSIALDHNGNLYIADRFQKTFGAEPICGIRKVNPNGIISTIASACAFSGFTVDPAGNPVVADEHYVRRYNADGSNTIIAGSGTDAYQCSADDNPNPSAIGDGGPATAAAMSPGVIAYDSSGNLYIGETLHPRIRKVDSNGVITTVAGLGCFGIESSDGSTAATASIGYAGAFAFDTTGALYIHEGAGFVRRIANGILDTALNLSTLSNEASLVEFSYASLAIDGSGALVLTFADRVLRASSANSVAIIAGSGRFRSTGDGGPARNAPAFDPMGVTADAAGNIYFTESLGSRLRMVSASTGVVSTIAGTGVAGCSGDGGPAIHAQFFAPIGATPDGNGGVYVVDFGCGRVRHVTPDGVIQTVSDTHAFDVAVDQNGELFVSQISGKIVRISPNGQTIPIAGTGLADGAAGDGGPAVNARVGASSLAVDPAGNLYIADAFTKSIRVVDPSGTIREYANFYTSRIATDAAGNLYAIGNGAGNPGDMETSNQVYRVQQDSIVPIEGLTNIAAITAGPANTLYVVHQRSDQSPLQADSEIRKVTVSSQASKRR